LALPLLAPLAGVLATMVGAPYLVPLLQLFTQKGMVSEVGAQPVTSTT